MKKSQHNKAKAAEKPNCTRQVHIEEKTHHRFKLFCLENKTPMKVLATKALIDFMKSPEIY